MSFVFAQKAVEEVDLSNQLLFPKIACHVFCSFVHLYKDEGRAHSTSPPQIACLKEKVAHEELRSSRDEEVHVSIINIILILLPSCSSSHPHPVPNHCHCHPHPPHDGHHHRGQALVKLKQRMEVIGMRRKAKEEKKKGN